VHKFYEIRPTIPEIQPETPEIPVIREIQPKISENRLENLGIRRKIPETQSEVPGI